MDVKKNRLFVKGDDATDGLWIYCGGPEIDDALKGLNNALECFIDCALSDPDIDGDVQFKVKPMTDEEVEAIPEE